MMKSIKMQGVLKTLMLSAIIILITSNCSLGKAKDQGRSEKGEGKRHSFTLRHDGLERKYEVYVPPSFKTDGAKQPLVLYIHGGGGKIRSAYLDGLDGAADDYGFILAVPEATSVKRGFLSTRWNGGKWQGGECCGNADDIGFISRMIDEVVGKFNIDETKVYATGISNGGLMVNRIACELAHKVAAVATVAPAAVPEPCNPSRPISVMDIHGTGDPINHFDGKQAENAFKEEYRRMPPHEVVEKWKKINACSEKEKLAYQHGDATCNSYQCRDNSEVIFCRVENMGHVYPSGSQYFFESIVGPVSYDLGPKQIFEFFMRHSLNKK